MYDKFVFAISMESLTACLYGMATDEIDFLNAKMISQVERAGTYELNRRHARYFVSRFPGVTLLFGMLACASRTPDKSGF